MDVLNGTDSGRALNYVPVSLHVGVLTVSQIAGNSELFREGFGAGMGIGDEECRTVQIRHARAQEGNS